MTNSIKIGYDWMRCIKCGFIWHLIETGFRCEIMCNECEIELKKEIEA